MALILSIGLSKKLGLPAFSSVGASCNVQVEMDSHLLERDLDGFHTQVQSAFSACRQAVEAELGRHTPAGEIAGASQPGQDSGHVQSAAEESTSPSAPSSNGKADDGKTNGQQVTQRQLEYLRQLAGQIPGLGIRRLEPLSNHLVGKPLAGLSSHEASGLIDTLKAVKAGQLELADLANQAAS